MPIQHSMQAGGDPNAHVLNGAGPQSYYGAKSPFYAEIRYKGPDTSDLYSDVFYVLGHTQFSVEISGSTGSAALNITLEGSVSGNPGTDWKTLATIDYNAASPPAKAFLTVDTVHPTSGSTSTSLSLLVPRYVRLKFTATTNANAFVNIWLVGI